MRLVNLVYFVYQAQHRLKLIETALKRPQQV
jgi:hypothetical protein